MELFIYIERLKELNQFWKNWICNILLLRKIATERNCNLMLKGINTKDREELCSSIGCKRKCKESEIRKGNRQNSQKKSHAKGILTGHDT